MRRLPCLAFIGLAVTFIAAADRPADYIEGEAIVTFKESTDIQATKKNLVARAMTMPKHFAWLSQHRRRPTALVRGKGFTTAALIAELKRDPSVETVEPNYRRWVTDFQPNDPYFSRLWALCNSGQSVNGTTGTPGADIRFPAAQSLSRPTDSNVVVAVIDTGMDCDHPDLAANVWFNPGEIPGNGVDDDGNGYVDDLYGYDFLDARADPVDSGSHGTHVAGTIAAVGNNNVGIIGAEYRAKIMALRVSNDGVTLDTASVIEALQYVALMKNRGVNIVAVNASFGGSSSSTVERAAIQAVGDVGVVFCAAAGNNGTNNDSTPVYPASYRLPNMIVVAATDQNDALASFSNYGATSVDLAAPGVNIFSTIPVTTTASVIRSATTYAAYGLTHAGTTTGLTAAIYDCGLGYPTNFPAAVSNNIALIKRGTLYFTEKVRNAMAAGAIAAIIDNNTNGNFLGTLQYPTNWIPAVSISLEDGTALRAALPTTGTVVNAFNPDGIYQYKNGTSMATPHVAAAVAFATVNFPGENATQRVQRLLAAVDLQTNLIGKVITGGRLNLLRVVDANANGLPDWWEQQYFGQTGVAPDADPDGDGVSNYGEFLAGTDPRNAASCLRATAAAAETGGFRVTWSSVPGKVYRLWYTDNLTVSWSVLQSNVAASAGATTSWLDITAAGLTQRFYRVQILPP